jgi:hypothetical protein
MLVSYLLRNAVPDSAYDMIGLLAMCAFYGIETPGLSEKLGERLPQVVDHDRVLAFLPRLTSAARDVAKRSRSPVLRALDETVLRAFLRITVVGESLEMVLSKLHPDCSRAVWHRCNPIVGGFGWERVR